jgi:serine/threonine-protein kinase
VTVVDLSAAPISLPERFELDREIGRGGMAVVYRAHDRHLQRFVAIKVLSADLSNTVGAERFEQEISLMAKLVHPGIVALFDSGEFNGRLYFVMPFVAAETLRARLAREQRLLWSDSAALGADIAEALAYAHGMGIVHRDVKPENVFAVGGRAVLTDFGIARIVHEQPVEARQLTTSGMVVGTVAYMSPEQAAGEPTIDGRSDLYSLGCVLHELVTGEPPFTGPTMMAVLTKHMTEAPLPLSSYGIRVASGLEQLVLALLAKNPDDRPGSSADVARLLRATSYVRVAESTPAAPAPPIYTGLPRTTILVRFGADEPRHADLAESLGGAVAGALVNVPGLRVIVDQPRAGSLTSSGAGSSPAATIIDGRVRASADRIRVSVRATGPDGAVQWAHVEDGVSTAPFDLEDAVAGSVTRHVVESRQPVRPPSSGPPSSGSMAMRFSVRSPTPAPAHDARSEADVLVALGMNAFNKYAPSGGAAAFAHLDEAKAYFVRALALDPSNARGRCALGNWHYVMAAAGRGQRAEMLANGRDLIYSALAVDDRCAEVHSSLAKLALYYDDDFHAAARHIHRAVELDPSDAAALRVQSVVYKILGQADDAVNAARAATRQMPDSGPMWNALADALLAAGRNAEAVDALKAAIAILPGYAAAFERMELARRRLGEMDLALELRSSRLRAGGQSERADLLDHDAESLGAAEAIRRDLRRELEGLLEQARTSDPFEDHVGRNVGDRIVGAYAELGEWHRAMDWVERAYERRPGRLRRMLADLPIDYRGLAVDPRYARLMRVAGLEGVM